MHIKYLGKIEMALWVCVCVWREGGGESKWGEEEETVYMQSKVLSVVSGIHKGEYC